MNMAIIGAGVVGQATGKGFARFGYDVHFYDFNPDVVKQLKKSTYSASEHQGCAQGKPIHDVIFICVPEDYLELDLWRDWYRSDLWVVRSTVPVGSCEKLQKIDWDTLPKQVIDQEIPTHRCVCHNPEFLREQVSEFEFMNPDRVVIGECCKRAGDILEDLYTPFNVPIIRVDTDTSELMKLVSNAYLATQISFWNQIDLIASKLGVNSHVLGHALTLDPRISSYGAHMHGKQYGMKCLPKDLAQLKLIGMKNGVTTVLLDAVKDINDNIELLKGAKAK